MKRLSKTLSFSGEKFSSSSSTSKTDPHASDHIQSTSQVPKAQAGTNIVASNTPDQNLHVIYLKKYNHSNIEESGIQIPDEYAIHPMLSHVFECELQSLLKFIQQSTGSKIEDELWWMEDLYSDYEDLNAVFTKSKSLSVSNEGSPSPQIARNEAFYPHGDMTTAGVIVLHKDQKDDGFIRMIRSTYKGTNRDPGSTQMKKKITFLSDGIALKSLEFFTEKDYFGLIYAIKRHLKGYDVTFTGKCSFSINSNGDTTINKGNENKSIFSKFTSSSAYSNPANLKEDSSALNLDFLDGLIRISDKSNVQVLSFNLNDIQAIAITLDSPAAKSVLLKVDVQEDSLGLLFQYSSTDISAVLHSLKADNISSSLTIPISMEEIDRLKSMENDSTAMEANSLPKSVHIISKLALLNGNLDAADIGENMIPYYSFLKSAELQSSENIVPSAKKLRVNEVFPSQCILKETDARRGVRICIRNAMGLPSSNSRSNIPPSAYCTVYLVGQNNDKLTLNTIESRTEVIERSSDPIWEKEVILEGGLHVPGIDTSGLEGVVGVMVKVRDSASGFLKHYHIGQVVIPINCFIYQTEAKLTLPLEPTNRMNKDDKKFLGEITLTTELVTLESTLKVGNEIGSKDPEHVTNIGRRLSIVSPRQNSHYFSVRKPGHDGPKQVKLSYSLHDTSNFSATWWPFKALYGGDAQGHIQANHSSFLLSLLPGASGVLINCKEIDPHTSRVIIPWNQITSVSILTETIFMVTITVNHNASLPSQRAKGEIAYNLVQIDLLISPCPASNLERVIEDRLHVSMLRTKTIEFSELFRESDFGTSFLANNSIQMASMASSSNISTNSDGKSQNYHPNTSINMTLASNALQTGSTSPPPAGRGRNASAWTNNSSSSSQTISAHATSCKQLLHEAKSIYSVLERSIHKLSKDFEVIGKNLKSKDNIAVDDPNIAKYITMKRNLLRYYIYLSQLMSLCRYFEDSLHGPSYKVDQIHKIVAEDCSDAQILTPLRSEANPDSLADRHDYIFDMAVIRLCDYLLCSGNQWGKYLDKGNALIETLSAIAVKSTVKEPSNQTPLSKNLSSKPPLLLSPTSASRPLTSGSGIASGGIAGFGHQHNAYSTAEMFHQNHIKSSIHSPTPSIPSSSMMSPPTPSHMIVDIDPTRNNVNASPSAMVQAKLCIEELLSGYNNALRLSLFPYIHSKSAFHQIEGLNLKHTIIRLIFDTNTRLHDVVSNILATYGLTIYPTLYLLDHSKVDEIVEWYSSIILKDMKYWLSKTISQALISKQNTIDMPWDVDIVGSKIISYLPESLRLQINVYLELCEKSVRRPQNHRNRKRRTSISDIMASSRYKTIVKDDNGEDVFTKKLLNDTEEMSMNQTTSRHYDSDEEEDEEIDKRDVNTIGMRYNRQGLYIQINEKIMSGVMTVFLMLCEEYNRALSTKHWDQESIKQSKEMENNMKFIISVVNDSYRIITNHIYSFAEIHLISSIDYKIDSQIRLLASYISLSDRAMKYIIRIIFADVAMILINFDTIFMEITFIRSLTATLTRHYNYLQTQIERSMYRKLIQNGMNIIIRRYLLFFKDRSMKKKSFTIDEINKLYSDISQLGKYFNALIYNVQDEDRSNISDQDNQIKESMDKIPRTTSFHFAGMDVVNASNIDPNTGTTVTFPAIISKQFAYLSDMIDLLRLDSISVQFSNVIRSVIFRYHSIASVIDAPIIPSNGSYQYMNHVSHLPCCFYSLPMIIFSTFMPLRADYDQATASLISAIYEESVQHNPIASSNQLINANHSNNHSKDVSGIATVNGNGMNTNRKVTMPNVLISSKNAFYDDSLHVEELFLHIFSEEEILSAMMSKDSSISTTNPNVLGFSLSSPQAIKFNPSNALKAFREKAADMNVLRVGTKRKNEEYALQLYRSLGLEESLDTTNNSAEEGIATRLDSSFLGLNDNDDLVSLGRKNSENSESMVSYDDLSNLQGVDGNIHDFDCTISISNIQVKGLRSASFFSNPNPYIAISLGQQRMKTSVKAGCTEAEWKHVVLKFKGMKARLSNAALVVRVYDKEMIRRKRLLGTATVKLATVELRPIESWFALEGGAIGSMGDVYMKIEVDSSSSAT